MADLNLKIGQSSTGSIVPLEADGMTVTPGAVVSAQTWSLTDPALSVVTNPDGTVGIKGVSPTTTDVTGTASATVTDADGTVGTFTKTFTVSVTAPTGRTTQIGTVFTAPA